MILNLFLLLMMVKVFCNEYAAKCTWLELLLDILKSSSEKGVKEKGDASAALHKLAAKASCLVSPFDAFPLPTPQVLLLICVLFPFVYFDLFSLFIEPSVLHFHSCII